MPPASMGIVAITRCCWRCSNPSIARSSSCPPGMRSRITVGAPIIATGTTTPSSPTVVGVDDPDAAVLPDGRLRHERADPRVPAAAGAEERRAEGQVGDGALVDRVDALEGADVGRCHRGSPEVIVEPTGAAAPSAESWAAR